LGGSMPFTPITFAAREAYSVGGDPDSVRKLRQQLSVSFLERAVQRMGECTQIATNCRAGDRGPSHDPAERRVRGFADACGEARHSPVAAGLSPRLAECACCAILTCAQSSRVCPSHRWACCKHLSFLTKIRCDGQLARVAGAASDPLSSWPRCCLLLRYTWRAKSPRTRRLRRGHLRCAVACCRR
jgi:hypothetical protein